MTNTHFIGKPEPHAVDRLTARKGYKVVALRYNANTNTVETVSPHYPDVSFPLSADSVCAFNHKDFIECPCGFYAYKTIDKAGIHWEQECRSFINFFVVEVALSGKVLVAENGYKASHQRITQVFLNNCWNCSGNSSGFALHDNGFLIPSCSKCSPENLSKEQFSILFSPHGFAPVKVESPQNSADDTHSAPDAEEPNVDQVKKAIDTLSSEGRIGDIDDIILYAQRSMFQGLDFTDMTDNQEGH